MRANPNANRQPDSFPSIQNNNKTHPLHPSKRASSTANDNIQSNPTSMHSPPQFFPSPASLRISSLLASASFCAAFAASIVARLRLSSSSFAIVQTTFPPSVSFSQRPPSLTRKWLGKQKSKLTRLIRLGILLQLRHKLVKLLLPLLPALDAALQQVGVVSRPELLLARAEPVRKRRAAHRDYDTAVLCRLVSSFPIHCMFSEPYDRPVGVLLTPRGLCSIASNW